jgi:hypothetical protein
VPIDDAGGCDQPKHKQMTDGFSVQEPIAFDAQGYLYGTVFNDNQLVRLTPTGSVEPKNTTSVTTGAITVEPPGLPTSKIFFTTTGEYLYSLQVEAYGQGSNINEGHTCSGEDFRYIFHRPLDPSRPSYREIVGTRGDLVVTLDPLVGDCTATLLSGLKKPHGIAEDANRNLYVADALAGQIWRIVPTGQSHVVASGLSFPTGIVFDPTSGLLFVSETTANKVVTIPPASSTCPTGVALMGAPNRQSHLTALHAVRGQVLNQTAAGQEYTRLFYQHSAEVAYLLVRHPELRRSARDLLSGIQPALQALLTNEPASLNSADVSGIERFITALNSQASPALQADLQAFQSQLRHGTALAEIGLSIAE